MTKSKYPALFQINTRVWLTAISQTLGRKATLDDIPETELDHLAEMGFEWIWFLSVWTTGPLAQKISRENPDWRRDYEKTLPDLREEDIIGSGFAIAAYAVHPDLGGDAALARLRKRLQKRGLKLMLDFVPNHMGPDHPWIQEHPGYFITGTAQDLEDSPQNYTRIKRDQGDLIFAYGRDPYFSGWPDTVQLDYSNFATVEAMTRELLRISSQCDGLRCDMAMLVLPEIFEKTWGQRAQSFWPVAIALVREKVPEFCFLAEVYWGMEWDLQQLGFDYTYDKQLYDRLIEGDAKPVREHLYAGLDYQDKLARFLENHDETRAASAFSFKNHKAAAIITFLSPGLRFFHQGQFEGRLKRISPHLVRAPYEPVNEDLLSFYTNLLAVIKAPLFRDGKWALLKCMPAWEGNNSWDSFLVFAWHDIDARQALVCVNYSSHDSQCLVHFPFAEPDLRSVRLNDMMSSAAYDRDMDELNSRGLFLDLKPWGYNIFEINGSY